MGQLYYPEVKLNKNYFPVKHFHLDIDCFSLNSGLKHYKFMLNDTKFKSILSYESGICPNFDSRHPLLDAQERILGVSY